MHQPWYGSVDGQRMILPWTRLHGLKDYLDMIAVVEQHPEVHVTFNLVPSLLAQLQQYVDGETTDDALEFSQRDAADLSLDERLWWMSEGFKCHWPRMLQPYPRYRELLSMRGTGGQPERLERAATRASRRDLLDLQVWFNLSWCGHELRTTEPVVQDLLRKGSDYTESEKQSLLAVLDGALGTIIPRYRAAWERGQVELATSPYYHPILPLLCHFPDAKTALPGIKLPDPWDAVPEDAALQLQRGRELCEKLLGHAPVGLWPSEGSVSDRALELAAQAGFRWAATDEEILFHTLGGEAPSRAGLFGAYQRCGLDLFFRDHRASDKIGFDYASWPAETAVRDLIAHLEHEVAAADSNSAPLASVILDGENCWEYYPHNGHDFLDQLYTALAKHPLMRTVTFSEYLAEDPHRTPLPTLFAGSWINHDFYIWAGHREDQRAWRLLFRARRALVAAQDSLEPAVRAAAYEHLYIAEGSDWYWWYGDDHSSADDGTFDELFRAHLAEIYRLLDQPVPDELLEAISGLPAASLVTPPVALFTPELDGRLTSFFEWRAAGRFEGPGTAGAMSRSGATEVLVGVRYGFDQDSLHLALELDLPGGAAAAQAAWRVGLEWASDDQTRRLEFDLAGTGQVRLVPLAGSEGFSAKLAYDRLAEVTVPRQALPASAGQTVAMTVEVTRQGELVERWPGRGSYEVPLPDDRDVLGDWLV